MRSATFLSYLKDTKAMLIRAILTAISLTACLSPGAKDEKAFLDVPKTAFEKKLDKMSDAVVDTTYVKICRNLVREKNKLAKAYDNAETAVQKEKVLEKARTLFATTLSDSIFV